MNPSKDAQASRRKQIATLTSKWCHRWFSPAGKWIGGDEPDVRADRPAHHPPLVRSPDARGTLWLCFGLLNGTAKDVALANAILAELPFSLHVPARSDAETSSPFDIFVSNHAVQLLVLNAPKLAAPVRAKMEGWAKAALGDHPGDRQADYQFHGHNDNMPSKATLGLVLGGEYFGDAAAVEQGLWNLRQLRAMLTRRGLVSEYTSGTYLPLTIVNLTEIASHARHPEARELARACVERVWADALGHFHPPTGFMGGPHSRAYTIDSTGHLSNMSYLLWCAFGEGVFPEPCAELDREPIRLVHHHDVRNSALGLLAWVSACELDPPARLVEWVKGRSYPFTLRASAERAETGEVNTTHHQEEDFALGTLFGDSWSQNQTESWFLQWRRRAPVAGPEDYRTAYFRTLAGGEAPEDSSHLLHTFGIANVLSEGRVALGLTRPKFALEGKEIGALKLTFVFPAHFAPLDRVEIADGHVFISDGPVHLALRPLNVTDWGRKDAVRVENVDRYAQVSFYNYEGPPRAFTQEELVRTLNGFVSVVGLAQEETFDAFRKRVLGAELVDYYHFGVRVTRYKLGDTLLETSWGVKPDRFRFAAVNGRIMPRPAWEATGLPAEKLPFLGEPPVYVPMEVPHKHLAVIWGPDSPWVIAAKGKEKLPAPVFGGKGWEKKA